MDELTLFTLALGLTKPWKVVDIKFSKESGRLDLRIDCTRGTTFPCPSCKEGKCQVHDTKDRRWRHLNFFQYETYLHARLPRVNCRECGTKQVEVPWSRPGSGFTLLFEMLVLQLSREMSIAAVAGLVGVHANRIWRILEHYVERARKEVDLSEFHILGIDEFSVRKGYEFMTAFSDIDASRVVFTGESRREEAIDEFAKDMESRGFDLDGIELICCDMWDPYLNGIEKYLPQASVVFDRFHIIKKMNKAIEMVRWAEQKENQELKKTRFIWLKRPENLTGEQEAKLAELKKLDLKTARAYQIKLALSRFWEIESLEESELYLKKWYFWATHSRLEPVKKAAKTFKSHLYGVLNYARHRITNASVEGINSQIETLWKSACGFRNKKRFRTAILFHFGGLDLYPVTH